MVDGITVLFVIFYLAVLFAGGISSSNYAIVYKQQNYSAWAPVLWPIKVVMTIAIFLMLLQAVSSFLKDIAELRGKPIA
jgi:TRAP-type mannitol/chloroaromatic compound transport system permease small subunit